MNFLKNLLPRVVDGAKRLLAVIIVDRVTNWLKKSPYCRTCKNYCYGACAANIKMMLDSNEYARPAAGDCDHYESTEGK